MLQQKVNAVTNLELQATVLQRIIQEKDALIDQLEKHLAEKEPSSSAKESTNAKGRKEEVPVL
jgi:flagellar biosynthesis/type III secretory pathway chaperone